MTKFEDFKPFFDAMISKMQTQDRNRGDSWRQDGFWKDVNYRYSSMGVQNRWFEMDPWLLTLLKEELGEYERSKEPEELLDIANFCAMIYIRSLESSAKRDEV